MISSGALELTARYGDLFVRSSQPEWIPESKDDPPLSFMKVRSTGWETKTWTILIRGLNGNFQRAEDDRATRIAAARHALAEIYDWFTEGFDTADLKDAKALLDELSA